MKEIFFSIITATKNPKNIFPTLESLRSQTFKNYENIIIDSSIKPIKDKIKTNYNFRYFYDKKLSLYEALNFGIKKSKGHIIFFLHSDDYLVDKKTLSQINLAFKKKEIEVVYGDIIMSANRFSRSWKSGIYNIKKIYKGWHPPHTSFFCKRNTLLKNGLFKTKYKIASDYELMIRLLLLLKPKNIKYLAKPIINIKIGGTSTKSIKNIITSNLEVFEILKSFKIRNYYQIIFFKIIRKFLQIRLK